MQTWGSVLGRDPDVWVHRSGKLDGVHGPSLCCGPPGRHGREGLLCSARAAEGGNAATALARAKLAILVSEKLVQVQRLLHRLVYDEAELGRVAKREALGEQAAEHTAVECQRL
jgi:hypothetical protein